MEFLNSRLMFGMQPGLKSTRRLAEYLGNPQDSFDSIHVVGTNGKGSTSFYLANVLQAHGLSVGFFSSPHLVNLRERIRVDGLPISEEDLDELLLLVKEGARATAVEPTFFEVLTLVAFLYYQKKGVKVAVLEAGMGGRLDSTAVACGKIAVLTSVGLEHTEVLGSTESAILQEKLNVILPREGVSYIVGGIQGSLLDEAKNFALSGGASFTTPTIRQDIVLPNLGRHYVENASLSLCAASRYLGSLYNDGLALKTLAQCSWAGRMQLLKNNAGQVCYILDGAHNSHAVRRLVESLKLYFPGQKFHCIFGALKDKDVDEMLRLMAPFVSHWHLTKTDYQRFRELDDLAKIMAQLELSVASAAEISVPYLAKVLRASLNSESPSPVLITGSLYMIGSAVQLLKNDFEELDFFRGMTPSTNEHR